ncbi:MAG: hypothetical protein LBH05_04255 [Deferribacteraceae bacterium]|jgi:hypothetical protein|nr:hypothetical protein [Deferribacteraceae bacterium]
MYEFVFIDPSPNLEMLSTTLRSNMGRAVKNIYTKDFTSLYPQNLWVFMGGKYFRLSYLKNIIEAENPMICKLKKPFFTIFSFREIKRKLLNIDPMLACNTFQDYLLFTGQLKLNAKRSITVSDITYNDAVFKYPESIIITSKVPAPDGKYAITHWRTDYDFSEALGDDYYLFFDGKNRHEFYRENNCFVTVSEHKTNLDWLKKLNPTFARFNFEKVKSINFHQNQNPWIQKYSSRVFIVNDYCWQELAVQMPDDWIKTFRNIICLENKRR